MQENVEEQSVKAPKKNHQHYYSKRGAIFSLGLIVVITLGGWGIYSVGYKNGKTKAEKVSNASKTTPRLSDQAKSLFTLPASGEISAISEKEVSVKVGNEIKKAAIDSKTIVSTKTGNAKISDIKSGSKTVLFTKKVGNQDIATRIVIQ